jgi:hypothetical protein
MGEIGILEGVGAGDRLIMGFCYGAVENGTTVDAFVVVITNACFEFISSSWSSSVLPVSLYAVERGGRPAGTNTKLSVVC